MGKGDLRSKKGKRVRKSWGVTRPRTDKGIGAFTPLSARTPAAGAAEPKAPKAKTTVKTSKPAPAKAVEAKTAAPKAKKVAKKADGADLTKIEGVGPKLSEVLVNGGIDSYETLAKTTVDKLKEILEGAGSRYKMFDPTSWPEQAALAAAGKWDELDALKSQLDGGRKK